MSPQFDQNRVYYTGIARTSDTPKVVRMVMELGVGSEIAAYRIVVTLIVTCFVIATALLLYSYGLLSPSRIQSYLNNQPATTKTLNQIRNEL